MSSNHPHDIPTLPPLSPLTYYRRNFARTLPVGGAIAISVFLIAAIVTLLNSVDASISTHYGFLRRVSVLTTQQEQDVPAPAVARVKKVPEVSRVVSSLAYVLSLKTVFGELPVPVYGVAQTDFDPVLKATGNRITQGRLPKPNAAEVVLSRMWANNFSAGVGQFIKQRDDELRLRPIPMKLVGIVEGGENIALCDRTFFELELPTPVQRFSYLLLPQNQAELPRLNTAVAAILKQPAQMKLTKDDLLYTRLYTFAGLVGRLRESLGFLYQFLAAADILVIGAVALMGAFLANIYFEQRLGEFGLLAAFGFRREVLAKRVVAETGILVVAGWVIGICLTWIIFRVFDVSYMKPRGLILSPLDVLALQYTLPTPIIVGIASLATVLLRLYKLDPIEIMERR
ncbi:MAG TPA: ABC transporter permease [Abditibacteriaceae bacterium]|jgi:hypothetical protein